MNKKITIFIVLIIQLLFLEAHSKSKIYSEISNEEKNFILKKQKQIKNDTKTHKSDANSIIAWVRPGKITVLDFLAAKHCAENKKFAFRFKDSGKTRLFYQNLEAYFYQCSKNLILKDSVSNSIVIWTNYEDQSLFKFPEKHLFLYRKTTNTYKKILKDAKKKDPSLFKPEINKVYFKDKNSIHIMGKKISNNIPARKIAADHCAKYKKNVYYFEEDYYSGIKASMLFYCTDKTFFSHPKTGKSVRYTNDSAYFIKKKNAQNKMFKEEFEKYGTKSLISYYFFEASNEYLTTLELLYRAYDLNLKADEFKAQIEYNKNSKYSESEKLKSTRSLLDKGSVEIEVKLTDASLVLSDLGRGYYEQSLPHAFSAAQNTVQLIITFQNVTQDIKSSGAQGFLKNFGEISGIFKTLPEINTFVKNMNSTIKLVFSGAKSKNVRDKGNLNKALDELNL